MHDSALVSEARPRRLFPEGHPLAALVAPTFDTVRAAMGRHLVSCIWMDSSYYPERAGYRVCYDELYGPGSTNVMPFIGSWLSTGPGSDGDGNLVVFPAGIDRTLIAYAVDIGLLGPHAFIDGLDDLRRLLDDTGRAIYSIDELGDDLADRAVISPALHRLLNSKESLADVSAWAPVERIGDMFALGVEDYRAVRPDDGGRVFLKTCNTESAGAGVFPVEDEAGFLATLAELREQQARFDLNRTLVIQPEIRGENRSFQVFVTPERPDEIQVITITDQLVEADGKTYKGSVNYPPTRANLEGVGPVIVDMVERVRARHPEVFGVLMCDYFETPDGRIVIYDPGVRPTGNTATAMAELFAKKLTGRDLYSSIFHLRTGVDGLRWADFVAEVGPLADPAELARTGVGVLPWGWNDVVGFGVIIGVAPDAAAFEALQRDVLARWS